MATVNVEIPDDKVDGLVDMYKARYGVTDGIKEADKLDFLGKMLSHETVQIIRQVIVEQAQAQATAAIKADTSINKTVFEAELETKAASLNVADQATLDPKQPTK